MVGLAFTAVVGVFRNCQPHPAANQITAITELTDIFVFKLIFLTENLNFLYIVLKSSVSLVKGDDHLINYMEYFVVLHRDIA
jgi:hypothetical protein